MIGTRPEAIKLAPVAKALRHLGIEPTLILTGQHAQLPLRECGLTSFAVRQLGCRGRADPNQHVRTIIQALLPLLRLPPDLLIVQGDTSSALGGALAARMARVPLAHVEAGLRTHDPAMPWPEEDYRVAIDAEADLLFAPTELSAQNLRREQVGGQIHVTGNTAIDAVLPRLQRCSPPKDEKRVRPRVLVTCHRRENWGDGLAAVIDCIKQVAAEGLADVDLLMPPNVHVRGRMRALLGWAPSVSLLEPCSQAELLSRMARSDLMLSDSGGIQEEAPALGLPLLVLRDKTERPEGIASGNMRLVGTDGPTILGAVRSLLSDPAELARMSVPAFPYGDGRAGPRIAALIQSWWTERTLRDHPLPYRKSRPKLFRAAG